MIVAVNAIYAIILYILTLISFTGTYEPTIDLAS